MMAKRYYKPINTGKPNVTYCWCDTLITGVSKVKFGYIWNIEKFSYFISKKSTGDMIQTSDFTAIKDVKNKWRLVLYPRGVNDEYDDYVSLLLEHVPDDESHEASATYELSIVNNNGEKSKIVKDIMPLTFEIGKPVFGYGYLTYILREDLMKESNGYMQNDTLIICCEIVISTEHKNSDEINDLVCVKNLFSGLSKDLERLLESKNLSDVILVAGYEELHAHKAILAARSPVFAAMFKHDTEETRENLVKIPDISFEVLKEMIRFIYTGKYYDLDDQKLTMQLLTAADKYGLQDLKLMCEQTLSMNVSADNFSDLITLASLHNADGLTNQLIEFMKTSASDDVIVNIWKNVIRQHPQLVAGAFQVKNDP